MVRQERAERTRLLVLRAAATEFDRLGYAGASLSRISKSAGVTMGALTFHFATKLELAKAVIAQGCLITQGALAPPPAVGTGKLRHVVEFTSTLVRLLEQEISVRAAARFFREYPADRDGWYWTWLPLCREVIARAGQDLVGWVSPAAVEALVVSIVSGAEVSVRAATPGVTARDQAALVWGLVLSAHGRPAPSNGP